MSVGIINKNPDTIRAFIAVELSADVKAALATLTHAMQRHPNASNVRWVSPDAIHLTLKFLGDIPSNRVSDVEAGMRQASLAVPPFKVSLGNVSAFPNMRSPRVIWVGMTEGADSLRTLAASLDRELVARGFTPEERGFSPHLTLGRAREGRGASARASTGDLLTSAPAVPVVSMDVTSVSLIRSILRPQGPQYTRLQEVFLTQPPA